MPQNKDVLGITVILGTKNSQSRVCMCVGGAAGSDVKLVLKADEEFCKTPGRSMCGRFFLRGPSTGKS